MDRQTGRLRSDTHNFVKLMVKISDLLDRAIAYLFENLNTDSKDYYPLNFQRENSWSFRVKCHICLKLTSRFIFFFIPFSFSLSVNFKD